MSITDKDTSYSLKDDLRLRKKPVIMQVIPRLGAGGAEQGCIDVAEKIVNSGARAIVVSNGGNRVAELKRTGAIHIDLPVHSKNPLKILANGRALAKIIRKHDVDIVHARSRAPAWSALRACEKTGAKFMTTAHAPYNINNNWKRKYNSAIAMGERVIAISNYVADYLLSNYRIDPRNIRIIHRGIKIERFHPNSVATPHLITLAKEWRLPDCANIVMMPGRITRWKGHHVLIDAIAKLGRDDVYCVMIGSDQGRVEYRKELENAIKEKKQEGKIRIIDHCDNMPAAYMMSAVVISASTDPEGFGRVPVEAQAMGKPVIATDHGGACETIVRNETGWLVPPGDSDALCNAIEEALSLTPAQRANLANTTMAHIAQNFTVEKMCNETIAVYRELLAEKYNLQSAISGMV